MWKRTLKQLVTACSLFFTSQLLLAMPVAQIISNDPQLSPPWFIAASLVETTLGQDPCVTVGPVESPIHKLNSCDKSNPFIIPIYVCDAEKADKLALFTKTFINNCSKVEFRTISSTNTTSSTNQKILPQLNPEEIKVYFNDAFKDNPSYVTIENSFVSISPIFTPGVVQFYCDDISVPSRYCFYLTADAFRQVLKETVSNVGMSYTTNLVK